MIVYNALLFKLDISLKEVIEEAKKAIKKNVVTFDKIELKNPGFTRSNRV